MENNRVKNNEIPQKAKHRVIYKTQKFCCLAQEKQKHRSHKNLYTDVHKAALFIITNKWKGHTNPSTNERINKMWYISIQWNIIRQ